MQKDNLHHFFENIENGQDLGHHITTWWFIGAKIIIFFGSIGNKTTPKISHTSTICNVRKLSKNRISFNLLESTKKMNVNISTKKYITRVADRKYVLTGFKKNENLYWDSGIKLNEEQKKAFKKFKNIVIGKKYSRMLRLRATYAVRLMQYISNSLHAGIENIDFVYKKDLDNIPSFFCSELAQRKNYELKIITEEEYNNNPHPDPMAFFKGKNLKQLQ